MNILLATDGSDHAQAAHALLTRLFLPTQARLTVLCVVEEQGITQALEALVKTDEAEALRETRESERQAAQELASSESERFRDAGWEAEAIVRRGHPAEKILEAAEDIGADLVVVGAQGLRGRGRSPIGSVARKVYRNPLCSCLVVRPPKEDKSSNAEQDDPDAKILLAFNGSEAPLDTLQAMKLDDRIHVTIISVITVATKLYRHDILERMSKAWQEYQADTAEALEDAAKVLRSSTQHVETRLLDGGTVASDEILDAAVLLDVDVVMLGGIEKSAVRRLFVGSVSTEVTEYAHCSVWNVV